MCASLSALVYFSAEHRVWCSARQEPERPRINDLPVHLRRALSGSPPWQLSPLPADFDARKGAASMCDGILVEASYDSEAMLLTCEATRTIVIVFRGTESVSDVLVDLRMSPIMRAPGSRNWWSRVHRGFALAYRPMRPLLRKAVQRLLQQSKYERIIVTGHSLGGALATLCAFDLARLCNASAKTHHQASRSAKAAEICLFTFGSPRVGNGTFVKEFDGLVGRSFRFVNDRDIVPTGPYTVMGFRHERFTDHDKYAGYATLIHYHAAMHALDGPSRKKLSDAWLALTAHSDAPRLLFAVHGRAHVASIHPAPMMQPDVEAMASILTDELHATEPPLDVALLLYAMQHLAGDGTPSTYQHFVIACHQLLFSAQPKMRRHLTNVARLSQIFAKYDCNLDTYLTLEELTAMLASERATLEEIAGGPLPHEAEALFKACDLDSSNDISRQEFCAVLPMFASTKS